MLRIRAAAILALMLGTAVPAFAGTITDSFVSQALQSLDPETRATRGGIQVSPWVILFYVFYLGTIWSFVLAMFIGETQLVPTRRAYAKNLTRANMFLASGDTAMFIAFLIAYLFPDSFSTPQAAAKLQQLLLLGVVSTSITMSIYYLYLGFYYRDRFLDGRWGILFIVIIAFFVMRILLHYNPENIWFSMTLPPGQPNYSAWLRNLPLFIYGLLAVAAILVMCWWSSQSAPNTIQRTIDWCMAGAMICLILSFAFYAIDVFYSHKIDRQYIWIIYTLKTLAYMGAFFLMWLGEFHLGRRQSSERLPPDKLGGIS